MTENEIIKMKVEISRTMAERMETAFVGRSINDVSVAAIKSFIFGVLDDLKARGELRPVVDLIDYNIAFEGNVMKISATPKAGLNDDDYWQAVDFLFNRGSDSARNTSHDNP